MSGSHTLRITVLEGLGAGVGSRQPKKCGALSSVASVRGASRAGSRSSHSPVSQETKIQPPLQLLLPWTRRQVRGLEPSPDHADDFDLGSGHSSEPQLPVCAIQITIQSHRVVVNTGWVSKWVII